MIVMQIRYRKEAFWLDIFVIDNLITDGPFKSLIEVAEKIKSIDEVK